MKKELWINNICTILATVVGVYLAASAGFDLAIDFENGKSKKDTFYVAQALYSEAKQNADNMLKWSEEFQASPGAGIEMREHRQDYALNTFVWQTMKESSGTFELPFQYLGKIQTYYVFSEKQIQKMLDSPMSTSLAQPLADKSSDILSVLEQFKQHVDKEKSELLLMGFTL